MNYMRIKKVAALFLAAIMICSLTACESKDDDKKIVGNSFSGEITTCTPTPKNGGNGDNVTPAPTDVTGGNNTDPGNTPVPTEDIKPAEYEKITTTEKPVKSGAVIIIGKQAFEGYNYQDKRADSYAKAVNDFADKMKGKAKVYSIVIPLSAGITMPDAYQGAPVGNSDMLSSLKSIYGKLGDNVIQVPIYDTLMQHRKEYIYFNTDHHWTQLGAYYAYVEFCKKSGKVPEKLSELKKVSYTGFTGSFCKDTGSQILYDNPDTLDTYAPKSECVMTVTDSNGKEFKWPVINNVSNYKSNVKYSAFIAGDNPYTVINNKNLSDGSACILVKESFGNAFAPFLADHYEKVYVVDYRYYKGTLSELVTKTGAKEVIFANNVSMIRNTYLIGQLSGIAK